MKTVGENNEKINGEEVSILKKNAYKLIKQIINMSGKRRKINRIKLRKESEEKYDEDNHIEAQN